MDIVHVLTLKKGTFLQLHRFAICAITNEFARSFFLAGQPDEQLPVSRYSNKAFWEHL